MSENSIVKLVIDDKISKLQDDVNKIDIEMTEFTKQVLDFDNKHYSSHMDLMIKHNKFTALRGIKKRLENEINLYKTSFTDNMIADLDYILEEYYPKKVFTKVPKGKTGLIVDARVNIVRFKRSRISENDYKRDTNAILKKIDQVSQFINLQPNVIIPKQQHEILKQLINELSEATMERLGFLNAAKEGAFPKEAIKAIVDTISTLKKLPSGQSSFDDMWAQLLCGKEIKWKTPK